MPGPSLIVSVYGTPAPQGSKRHVGNGRMVESSKKVAPWREDVRQAALAAMAEQVHWDPSTPFVSLRCVFRFDRPKSHFRTGEGTSHLLRPAAPSQVGVRPDLDKLIRSTADALTSAGAYRDDSRVVVIHARKVYVATGREDRPGAAITLEAYA